MPGPSLRKFCELTSIPVLLRGRCLARGAVSEEHPLGGFVARFQASLQPGAPGLVLTLCCPLLSGEATSGAPKDLERQGPNYIQVDPRRPHGWQCRPKFRLVGPIPSLSCARWITRIKELKAPTSFSQNRRLAVGSGSGRGFPAPPTSSARFGDAKKVFHNQPPNPIRAARPADLGGSQCFRQKLHPSSHRIASRCSGWMNPERPSAFPTR